MSNIIFYGLSDILQWITTPLARLLNDQASNPASASVDKLRYLLIRVCLDPGSD